MLADAYFAKVAVAAAWRVDCELETRRPAKGAAAIGLVKADGGYDLVDGSRNTGKVSRLEEYLGGKMDRSWKWIG